MECSGPVIKEAGPRFAANARKEGSCGGGTRLSEGLSWTPHTHEEENTEG